LNAVSLKIRVMPYGSVSVELKQDLAMRLIVDETTTFCTLGKPEDSYSLYALNTAIKLLYEIVAYPL
jgi:hypothetical protein